MLERCQFREGARSNYCQMWHAAQAQLLQLNHFWERVLRIDNLNRIFIHVQVLQGRCLFESARHNRQLIPAQVQLLKIPLN